MAARKAQYSSAKLDVIRARVRVGMLMNHLQNHVLGKIPLTGTQLKAAEILLRKVVPDMSAVEHTGTIEHKQVHELTNAELAERIASLSAGRTAPQESPQVTH